MTRTSRVEELLDLVRARLGPTAQAEVTWTGTTSGLTRFANSFIHQNVVDTEGLLTLRLHHDGRTCTGATSDTGADGRQALLDRVLAAAALLPPDPDWPGLTPSAITNTRMTTDRATADARPADRADVVRAFVNHSEGLLAAGFCRTSEVLGEYGNTAGQWARGSYTEASLDGVARAKSNGPHPADGVARAASYRLADIDGAVLGARAAAKARASADPIDLPPGRYEVVLEPQAVNDLIQGLALYGFNAKAVAEQRSFVAIGEQQFDASLSIVDDAGRPGSMALPFDTEGTPRQRVRLVENGCTLAVTHDRRTARELGAASTGHANASGASVGPVADNIAIRPTDPGGAPATEVDGPMVDSDVEQLVAGVDRGLLVTDFWYTRALDPRPIVVTGLTRNGLWLVEDGAVTRPVTNLRFTQAYPAALAPGQVLGVGRHSTTMVPGAWFGGPNQAPALRLASWNFTGGAAG